MRTPTPRLLVAATLTATLATLGPLAGTALAAGPARPTAANWAALRQCESSGDYSINTHNGYYGAYQFSLATWRGLGFSGLPSAASPATQNRAALLLWEQAGWAPWPTCSTELHLGAARTAARRPVAEHAPRTGRRPTSRRARPARHARAHPRVRTTRDRRPTYRVRAGDTLSAIALRYHTSVAALARMNHIRDVNLIDVGQLLVV